MIEINLSENEEGPLYRQLYRHIRSLIQAGTLNDGMRLPSIRSLRQQMRVSKTTIETAYHMLLEEGYIVSKAVPVYSLLTLILYRSLCRTKRLRIIRMIIIDKTQLCLPVF